MHPVVASRALAKFDANKSVTFPVSQIDQSRFRNYIYDSKNIPDLSKILRTYLSKILRTYLNKCPGLTVNFTPWLRGGCRGTLLMIFCLCDSRAALDYDYRDKTKPDK